MCNNKLYNKFFIFSFIFFVLSVFVNSLIVYAATIDTKPKNKLEALTNYKLKIKRTISNSANQLLKEEFEMEFGFTTSATTIIDIGIQ